MTVQNAEFSFSQDQHTLEPHLAHSCFRHNLISTKPWRLPQVCPTPAFFLAASSYSHLAAEHFALRRKSRYRKPTLYFQTITAIDSKEQGSERPLIMRGEQN